MPPDRFLHSRAVRILSRDELAQLSTPQLLARLRKLQACFENLAALGYDYDQNDASRVEGILFKSSSAWLQAHTELKELLVKRDNVPGGAERAKARLDRAARNKTSERRR